jgi:hypothetical protein
MAASVLRKGGGLSEALQAVAAAAEAAAGPPGRAQQQQQQQADALLAGDWQGAEDGLSDVELELLLAEFSYVEQVRFVVWPAMGKEQQSLGMCARVR